MLENSVVLYLAVIAGIFITADAVDYCKLTCRHGSMHTMCKYPVSMLFLFIVEKFISDTSKSYFFITTISHQNQDQIV